MLQIKGTLLLPRLKPEFVLNREITLREKKDTAQGNTDSDYVKVKSSSSDKGGRNDNTSTTVIKCYSTTMK